ncbi:conserved hypothetical protein [Anaeromyxobacter dehalogenans 2CP-1]|uniref:Uncharacterized protein n=1 Tax=Anaeromyxobacter dehalogenans (strain ATCC BAA-258 / DSM 21875 / 2CP-1) TaxID=455488 RepID=B8J6A9_ANAD2|nr:hypothetical protein [Anaeromyxobacter dehalogenans]ACL65090.1 conserved hypothetical protein [Anaeromyxobacter dehalogenans 2CP-1]
MIHFYEEAAGGAACRAENGRFWTIVPVTVSCPACQAVLAERESERRDQRAPPPPCAPVLLGRLRPA